MKQLLPYVRRISGGPGPADDAGLLARFAAGRDEEAFAALVRRHGPLVLGVCRRWLGDATDADDAFQATFLVLVRRADTIAQPAQLAGWLHGVASRTARSLRSRLLRRRRRFIPLSDVPAPVVPDTEPGRLLDEEVARLPEKYRLPVVLCHLQGLSRREAARLLACPEGTLSVRLARALHLLRRRLLRRGVAPTAAAALLIPAAAEAVPSLLLKSTVRAAVQAAAPERIVALTEGVLRMFLIERLARAAACLLAVAVMVGGGAMLMNQLTGGSPALAEAPAKPVPPPIVLALRTAGDGATIDQVEVTEGDDRVTVHSLPALARYLKRVRLDRSASGTVIVRAGSETKYATVLSVLDSCRAAGFENMRMEPAPQVARTDGPWEIELRWSSDRVERVVLPKAADTVLAPKRQYEVVPSTTLNYDTIRLNYTRKLETAANVEQVQQEWLRDLTRFIEQSPNAAAAPEALLQLGQMGELAARPPEAKRWYERLVKQFPASREAVKARGSLKRLNSAGQPFELESTTLVGGKRFRVSDLKGKLVAVYYWASWHPGARADFAKLQTLRARFPDRFEVVGVNLDEQHSLAFEFVHFSPLKDAVHVRENGGLDGRLATDYGVNMLPTLFLLDRDGKVVRHDLAIGQLENEVKKLAK